MINSYGEITILVGRGSEVEIAINNLEYRLNTLKAKYETIGQMNIVIDRHSSAVDNSVQVFAIQMLGRLK